MSNLSPDDSARKGRAYLAANPGHKIFPVKAGKKFPPLVQDPYGAGASDDPAQIDAWAKQHPRCNWGVTAAASNLMIADIDTKTGKFGEATYDWLDLDHGWPPTRTVTTPSGGRHQYYSGPHIFALGRHGFGVDIDSPHYALIPGSVVEGSGSYELTNDLPIAPAPQWFYDIIKSAKTKIEHVDDIVVDLDQPRNIEWVIDYLKEDAEPAIEGKNGDHTTLRIAMSVKDIGISRDLAIELMNEHYNPRCEPPWPIEMLTTKVDNAFAYAKHSKTGGKTAEADFADDAPELDSIVVQGDPDKIAKQVADRVTNKGTPKATLDEFGRSKIVYREQDMPTVIADAMNALKADTKHDRIFRRGSNLVRLNQILTDDDFELTPGKVKRRRGALTICEIVPNYMALRLAEAAVFYVKGKPAKDSAKATNDPATTTPTDSTTSNGDQQ